jgi:glutathione S-transferase
LGARKSSLPYDAPRLARPEQKSPEHLARQPFGQAPAIEEDGLVMHESGAIALYIAEKSEALMPKDRVCRERATAWVFSAHNSIENAVQELGSIIFFHKDAAWAKERRPASVVSRRSPRRQGYLEATALSAIS